MKLCPSRGNLLTGHEKRLWYTLPQVLFLLGMVQCELVPLSWYRVSMEASRPCTWYQQLLLCWTKVDKSCFCRPVSIEPLSDSSAFRQVKEMGQDRESMSSESCPRWSSKSPTTLNMYAHLHTGLGWISGIALPSLLPSDV